MHDNSLNRMLNRPEYSDIYKWEKENGLRGTHDAHVGGN